jgi:hypothetical protein
MDTIVAGVPYEGDSSLLVIRPITVRFRLSVEDVVIEDEGLVLLSLSPEHARLLSVELSRKANS